MKLWFRQWRWLARRDWHLREVRILVVALWVAVATVATVNLFADRLQQSVSASGSQFLAADRQLRGSFKPPQAWLDRAHNLGLRHARMLHFSTMLSSGTQLQLTEIKAVGAHYPLAGKVQVRAQPKAPLQRVGHGPAPGHIWVEARLLPLLHVKVGDAVTVGRKTLMITRLLVQEPDAGFSFESLAPRALINLQDVPATGVVQPGSRIRWVDFFSGSDPALAQFHQFIKPHLRPDQRWVGIQQGRPEVSRNIDRAHRYLLLGASVAVLLSLLAMAVASRQYALRQLDAVALLKTLGLTHGRIASLYGARLGALGLVGTVLGLIAAWPLNLLLVHMAQQMLGTELAGHTRIGSMWPALVTAVVAVGVFAFPPVWRLRRVPPMRVLRDLAFQGAGRVRWDLVMAIVAALALLELYARQPWLVVALTGGALILILFVGGMGVLGLLLLRRIRHGAGIWRLALLGIRRHHRAALAQLGVTALVVMLAAVLYLVRTSLLSDWQAQIPPQAPNQFLINIAPDAVPQVKQFLNQHDLKASRFYPMVRGRLTAINGQPVDKVVANAAHVEALHRELNLSWSEKLPQDNKLVSGDWWPSGKVGEPVPISLEQRLAKQLNLSVGDKVKFVLADRSLETQVRSIRKVDWTSMKPNFYVLFPPKALQGFAVTWINSFYLPPGRNNTLNQLVHQFPTVTVLDIQHLISRLRDIIHQVTSAVQALLVMVLAAAVLVVMAILGATLPERQREGALLRTLGGTQKQLVWASLMEFAILGLLAGLVGVLAAQVVLWGLQYRLFSGAFQWHGGVWLWLPPASAVLLALVGVAQLGTVLRVSPMTLLRRLE